MPLTQERMGIMSSPSSHDIISEYVTSIPTLDSEDEGRDNIEDAARPSIQKKTSNAKDNLNSCYPRRARMSSPRRSKTAP